MNITSSEILAKGMAERRKVRPDCIYASNPFHECTEYCIKKTAESKAGKDKKSKGNNSLNVLEFQFLLALINYFLFNGFVFHSQDFKFSYYGGSIA